MPSVGMPRSKSPGSMRGAPSAYTDAGPPLRISACGLRARTCSAVTRWPTSSEYTRASRTRRAISCAYCPPRSKTSTGRSSGARSGSGRISAAIVRSLLRDRDVVRMALAQPCGRDAHELRALHVVDRPSAAVAHRLAQPADELVDDRRNGALVRDAPFDPLGHELLDVLDVALEVTVARGAARAHRAERAHPAVLLEPLALLQHDISRALVRPGEQRARHDGIGAGGDRLRDVAGRGHAAVGDDGNRGRAGALVDRRDLRDPDAGDDASRADRAWTYACLDCVSAGGDQGLRGFGGRHVPGDHLDVPLRLHALDHLRHRRRMAVRGVDDEDVDARIHERAGSIPRTRADPHCSADAKAA